MAVGTIELDSLDAWYICPACRYDRAPLAVDAGAGSKLAILVFLGLMHVMLVWSQTVRGGMG